MALAQDSLGNLIAGVRGDIKGRWKGSDTHTRRSPLDVLARVLGAVHHTVLGWVDTIALEMMANTSRRWVETHGSLWGVERLQPTFAAGLVTVSGSAGRSLPVGWRLRRSDGAEYAVDVEVLIGSSTAADVPVVAITEGSGANTAAGIPLTLVSPRSGISSDCTVASGGITGGADLEDPLVWRDRIVDHIRKRPQGGARTDYNKWTRAVSAAITRVWIFPLESGAGTVAVRFAMDDTYDDGIPLPADVATVQAYLDREDIRPVTSTVLVGTLTAAPLDPVIRLVPDIPSVRAAVEAELRDLLRREGAPATTLPLTHIAEAISIAAGETDHHLVSPAVSPVYAATELPTLGIITWVTT